MRLRILAIAGIFAVLAAPAPAQERPALKSAVIVQGEHIYLGDLFENAGTHAGTTIAYAPKPGRRAVFDATWLYNVARAFGLKWRPLSMQTQAVVERNSQLIQPDEIRDALRDSLARYGVGKDVEIEISNAALRLYVAADQPATVGVEGLIFDESSGRFTATVAAPAELPTAERTRVTGRVHQMVEIPVLAERKRTSDVIGEDDITWVDVRATNVGRATVTDAHELIGKAVRRTLRPNAPIRANDVRRPLMVPKGSLVTMALKTPMMQLTVKGKALEDGAIGDVVRIANLQTRTIVDAVVTGAGQVAVEPPARIAQVGERR
jgi:flagella basal body P-ring formation protein FlgA